MFLLVPAHSSSPKQRVVKWLQCSSSISCTCHEANFKVIKLACMCINGQNIISLREAQLSNLITVLNSANYDKIMLAFLHKWLEVVQRDCQVRGLSKDAMVRGRWRKMIRMVDEQEGCEWMNVSSGTGSPG